LRLGIDLAKNRPAVCAIRHAGSRRQQILHAGLWTPPPQCLDRGDVLDINRFAESLADYLSKHNLRPEDAVAAIPANRAFIDQLALDTGNDSEMTTLEVEHHLETALNCDASEIYFDYQSAGGPLPKLVVAALRKEMLDKLIDVFARLNLKLSGVDLEGFAQVDGAIRMTRETVDRQVCMVEADEHRVRLVHAQDGMVTFDQSMPVVGDQGPAAAGWSLEQLHAAMLAGGAQPKFETVLFATGARACYRDWLAVVERLMGQSAHSVVDTCPTDIDPEVWCELPAAYGLATGGAV
jgi:Tfp pilus assembly PilM family ATPase